MPRDAKWWQPRRGARRRAGLWWTASLVGGAARGGALLALLGACQGGSRQEVPAAGGAAAVTPVASVSAAVPVTGPATVPSGGEPPLPPERSGVCADLHASLASGGKPVLYYAEVTPQQQGAPMQWAAVRSRKEADERSPEGTALELWTVAEREGWRLAVLTVASGSKDSASESELCFRPDGSLVQTDARAVRGDKVPSGKRAEPGTDQRPEAPVVTKFSDLPFASLLEPAR